MKNKNNTIVKANHFHFGIVLFLTVCFTGVPIQVSASTFSSDTVINLVNESRENAGMNTLVENPRLKRAAQDKANDMLKNDYFAHTSPEGVTPWYWLDKEGYSPKSAGENLAINFADAKSQHKAWMNSPTHRDNIMSPKYKETGVAVVEGKIKGEKVIITVQFFGTSRFTSIQTIEKKEVQGLQTESITQSDIFAQEAFGIELYSQMNKIIPEKDYIYSIQKNHQIKDLSAVLILLVAGFSSNISLFALSFYEQSFVFFVKRVLMRKVV